MAKKPFTLEEPVVAASVAFSPVETIPGNDIVGEQTEQEDALTTLAKVCVFVASGNSTERLRTMTAKLYPKTKEEGKAFQETLDRFRLAANALHGYGQELYFGLVNAPDK